MTRVTARQSSHVTDVAELPDSGRRGVVAIGNFDGVHLGHRAVLDAALGTARQKDIPAVALTFEPHPRTYFLPERPVFRLTPAATKARLLVEMGFDFVIVQTFDREFAQIEAGDFVENLLAGQMDARHVVTGQDFHFGRDREGTPEFLRRYAGRLGIGVAQVSPVLDTAGEIISSTRIRDALSDGAVERANALLGRQWSVESEVVRGRQLGRQLGFPTANMLLPPQTRLRHGVYAVSVRGVSTKSIDAVASFGMRPTFDNGPVLLETYILDHEGDLYGRTIEVEFHSFLRPEEKFDSAEALVEQMHRDVEAAEEILRLRRNA